MAAVIQTTDITASPLRPHLRLVTPDLSPSDAIHNDHGVVDGAVAIRRTVAAHPMAATYARRRLGALVVLVTVVLAIAGGAVALATSVTFPGGAPLSAPGSTTGSPGTYDIGSPTESPLAVSVAETHVVRPGDTLWSIASDLVSGSVTTDDHGQVVAELVELNGGASLVVGQQILLPARPDLAFDQP